MKAYATWLMSITHMLRLCYFHDRPITIFATIVSILEVFDFCIMTQMKGSKVARLGVLFNCNHDADASSLLFMKAFEITTSSFRFVEFMKA